MPLHNSNHISKWRKEEFECGLYEENFKEEISLEVHLRACEILVGSPLKYMRFWDTLVGGDGTWGVGNEKTNNKKSIFLTKKSRNVFKIG